MALANGIETYYVGAANVSYSIGANQEPNFDEQVFRYKLEPDVFDSNAPWLIVVFPEEGTYCMRNHIKHGSTTYNYIYYKGMGIKKIEVL